MAVTISGSSGITTPGATLSSGSITFPDSSTLPSATFTPIYPISASVGGSALTVTLNACAISFRNATLTSGTPSTVTISSPISVTVSAGSTLGTTNAVQSTVVVLAINNGGTAELAVVNLAGGVNLDETTLISTTAEGGAGAADSSTTIYSTTARTNVPFRVIGIVTSTQATAGTWSTTPTVVQGIGGQAFAAMQSLGMGQTWQTPSRSSGVTYYNTTNRPIVVSIALGQVNNSYLYFQVNGATVFHTQINAQNYASLFAIVPPGNTYLGSYTGTWYELR